MYWLIIIIIVSYSSLLVDCQVNVITIPPQIGVTEGPIVYGIENSTNITVVCDVTLTSNDAQLVTTWRIMKGESLDIFVFNSDGTGANADSSNFYVTGELFSLDTTRANLSILVFDSSLDMALLQCGSGQSFPGEFNLRLIVIPSMPRDLAINNIGVDYVNISWINPVTLGTPTLTHFRINITSVLAITINATNTIDYDYNNVYIINGLQPDTEYNITVTGLLLGEQFGLLTGEESESIMISTTTGAPRLQNGSLQNINGSLLVSWVLIHNGGIALDNVTILCNDDDSLMIVDDNNIINTVSIGPISAGINYTCLITVANSIGSDDVYTNRIITNTGIPSSPIIVSGAFIGSEIAYLTLRVDHYGVDNITSDVSIVITDSSLLVINTVNPDSLGNPFVTVIINGTSVTNSIITTSNIFGSSVNHTIISEFINNNPFQVINNSVTTTMITTTTTMITTTTTMITTTTTTTIVNSIQNTSQPTVADQCGVLNSISITGSLIAVIVLLIILLVGCLLITIICFYQRRKNVVKNSLVDKQSSNDQLLILDAAYEIPNRSITTSNGVGEQIMTQNNLAYAPISSSNNKNNRVYETVHTT